MVLKDIWDRVAGDAGHLTAPQVRKGPMLTVVSLCGQHERLVKADSRVGAVSSDGMLDSVWGGWAPHVCVVRICIQGALSTFLHLVV